jgi:hypothetical protein
MFGSEPRDLAATLSEMERVSRAKSNFDQIEQKQRFREYLSHDTRFNGFDHNRLIERVRLCKYNGATLDLDDPFLRGGEKRPLDF